MKSVIITDTHWGVRNDDPNFLKYYRWYYKEYFFPLVRQNNIDHIIHLGDVFDRRKYINFNTLNMFNTYFIEPILKHNITLDVIIGNHDVYYKNTNKVNALNELFGNNYHYNIGLFDEYPMSKIIDGVEVLFVPWISDENAKSDLQIIENSTAKIMLCHLDLPGFIVNAGKLSDKGIVPRTMLNKFEMVLSGHYHTNQKQDNIHYLGSPYEQHWGDYNTNKGIHIIDWQKGTLEYIINDHRLHHKIVYNNKYNLNDDLSYLKNKFVKVFCKTKVDPTKFEMFLELLSQQYPFTVEVEDEDIAVSEELNEKVFFENAGSTINMIKTFVNSINISDTEKIEQINYLVDKYNEAINFNEDNS